MMVINGSSLIAFLTFYTFVMQSEEVAKTSSFKLYNNRYLPNHLIKSVRAMPQVECSMQCSAEEECESWNMYEASVSDRNCELNNATVNAESSNDVLQKKDGAIFGHRVNLPATKNKKTVDHVQKKNITYVFTNLGKEGAYGPNDTSGYLGTTLEGQVTLNDGIQMWHVPHTGTYVIESRGAFGRNAKCKESNSSVPVKYLAGLGARIRGKFWLTNGTLLKILVGQRSKKINFFSLLHNYGNGSCSVVRRTSGGGGGSFVTYANNTPLVIAGGGGSGGNGVLDGCYCDKAASKFDGDPGQLGVLGSRCNSTVGNGGILCGDVGKINAGSGAGLLSNGSTNSWAHSARCFVDGGRGGISDYSDGGFGGGGSSSSKFVGGAGGGYSGGGVWGNSTHHIAGGGGSVNHGFDKQSGYDDAYKNGLVKIVFLG